MWHCSKCSTRVETTPDEPARNNGGSLARNDASKDREGRRERALFADEGTGAHHVIPKVGRAVGVTERRDETGEGKTRWRVSICAVQREDESSRASAIGLGSGKEAISDERNVRGREERERRK